jgi:GT2 family glycosyltransferase
VWRYVTQFRYLQEMAPEHTFRPIIVEGDSTDNTLELLKANFNGAVSTADHNGPVFGSVDDKVRFRQSSWVWEHVLDRLEPEDDAFIYIESDLIWKPEVLLSLLHRLDLPGVDSVTPFISFQNRMYDVWGIRGLDGECFGFYPPHHVSLVYESPTGLYPISSAGSCLVMKGEMAKKSHFTPDDMAIVGFCWDAAKQGFKLWIDPEVTVYHP